MAATGGTVVLEREEFYELVWSEPMIRRAKRASPSPMSRWRRPAGGWASRCHLEGTGCATRRAIGSAARLCPPLKPGRDPGRATTPLRWRGCTRPEPRGADALPLLPAHHYFNPLPFGQLDEVRVERMRQPVSKYAEQVQRHGPVQHALRQDHLLRKHLALLRPPAKPVQRAASDAGEKRRQVVRLFSLDLMTLAKAELTQ